MYAVLVDVQIAQGKFDEAQKGLHDFVIPTSKGAQGFVKGTWFGDETSGHALVLFESEESAKGMAGQVASGPEDPVQIQRVQVYRVHAEA